MRWAFVCLTYLVFACGAWAGQVTFQSGEHDDFTRLVMALPTASTKWRLSGSGDRYVVTIEEDDLTIDTSSVFNRIRRERLKDISADADRGRIELLMNCKCQIKTRSFKDRFVILDISEKAGSRQARPERFQFVFDPIEADATRIFRFAGSSNNRATPASFNASEDSVSSIVQVAMAPETAVERQRDLAAARSQLLEQIGRAATQSLLDPVEARPATSKPPPPKDPRSVPIKNATTSPTSAIGNLNTRTVMDEAMGLHQSGKDAGASHPKCISDEALDIGSWAGKLAMEEQVSYLRANLFGEFDVIDPSVVVELARVYVHYTFGTEARQILSMAPDVDAGVLQELSYLVEGTAPTTNTLSRQGQCAGAAALWAALSGATLHGDQAVRGAVNAFNNLPRHLRDYLGPRLSARLSDQGQTEAAETVLKAVERLDGPNPPDLEVTQAKLASATGDLETAGNRLNEAVQTNSETTPMALVELIDLHVEQDLAPGSDTIALVGAFAVEHKHTELGPKLRRAHFLARLQSRDYEPALQLLDEIRQMDGEPGARKLRDLLAESLVLHADDFQFVEMTVGRGLVSPGALSDPVAISVAERLVAQGFFREARKQLQSTSPSGHSSRRSRLMARIALSEGLPRRAEAEILGVEGEEAARLRAAARAASGDHAQAATLLRELGDEPASEEQSWLAGDWPALIDAESAPYRTLALWNSEGEISQEPAPNVEPLTNGVLARNRGLLEKSAEVRNVIDDLLELHPAGSTQSN